MAPRAVVVSFTAGGQQQSLTLQTEPSDRANAFHRYAPLRLPVGAQALDFRIAPSPAVAENPPRMRYRLEGWDEDWRDVEGTMFLSIRFIDAQGRRISSAAAPRSGQSRGWTGFPQTAVFHTSRDTIVPPQRARQIQVFFTGGGSRTMGTWLVKGIRITAPTKNGPPRSLLVDHFDQGDDLNSPRGVPTDWRREGTNSSIAQMFTLDGGRGYALALIDRDVLSTGRWLGVRGKIVDVEPEVPLQIELDEAYSIGATGNATCSYQKLPAGRYAFHVMPVDAYGVQSGAGVTLPVALVPPFYSTGWFWSTVAVAMTAGVAGAVRFSTRRRLQRQLEVSEQRRAIEVERMRIAQDIHDDMGARLTQISLASGLALRNTPPDSAASADLKRLDRAARDVAIALDEIVWAVNPAHDTLEGLGNYISQYVTEITAESSLRCRLEIPALLPARFISSGVRHHLLMALKEALNNAIKHSGAVEVRVQLMFQDPMLTLTVADNGRGFDPAVAPAGNGIANMRHRLESVGGRCAIERASEGGVRVAFALQLGAKDGT